MDIDKLSVALATRLKQERTSRNLSHVALRNALKERYGIDISKDTLINYETGLNHAKTKKNLGMRVEYLMYFADFFGVSSDYLLGLSDVRSPDLDTRSICQKTGLTEKSLETLQTMTFQKHYDMGINALLSSENAFEFFDRMEECCYVTSMETELELNLRRRKEYRPELYDVGYLVSEYSKVPAYKNLPRDAIEKMVQDDLIEYAAHEADLVNQAKTNRDDLVVYNVQRVATKIAERIIEETYKNTNSEG